jgi:hypothetical protein
MEITAALTMRHAVSDTKLDTKKEQAHKVRAA